VEKFETNYVNLFIGGDQGRKQGGRVPVPAVGQGHHLQNGPRQLQNPSMYI